MEEGGWAQDEENASPGDTYATGCGGCGAVVSLQKALSGYRLVWDVIFFSFKNF